MAASFSCAVTCWTSARNCLVKLMIYKNETRLEWK
jgi:hypothetical protein